MTALLNGAARSRRPARWQRFSIASISMPSRAAMTAGEQLGSRMVIARPIGSKSNPLAILRCRLRQRPHSDDPLSLAIATPQWRQPTIPGASTST
jgi:hypothetical protein